MLLDYGKQKLSVWIFVGPLIKVTLLLYALGLAWGYVRLPWAAIQDLGDYDGIISKAPAVSLGTVDVSKIQRSHIEQRMRISSVPVTPVVHVSVRWNALVLARVQSGHYIGNMAAQSKDTLYVCVFGGWYPIYTFRNLVA